jgi:hypothetical protein
MTKTRMVRVFLSVSPVRRRGYEVRRAMAVSTSRYKAAWVTRGTTADLYTSKTCDTPEEAVKLALAWLARRNAPVSRMAGGLVHEQTVRYVDTTADPERFGYSLAQEPA